MNKPCYCCDNSRIEHECKKYDNALVSALDELGELSVDVENRKKEKKIYYKMHRTSYELFDGYKGRNLLFDEYKWALTQAQSDESQEILQKKSKYIEGKPYSIKKNIIWGYDEKTPRGHLESKVRSTRRKTRLLKPYELPWHHNLYQERTRTASWNHESDSALADETTCSSTSSSSSAGNRSNPASPSKTTRPDSGNGLVRSRSLDELNCPAWDSEETQAQPQPQTHCREEIENVSQQIRHMTIT